MEDKKYIVCTITKECIPIMLEAFKSGVCFSAHYNDWHYNLTTFKFTGKTLYSHKDNMYYVRVTNDERRRLLSILKKLSTDSPF